MPLTTRVWSAGKILVIAGALLGTYLISAMVSMRMALRSREVQVPNLVGRTANDATTMAGDLGLTVRVDDTRRPDAKIPAGQVLAQDPAAGSTARQRRSVRIWLSAGLRAATVPPLVGETERTAQLRLVQDGLALSGVSEIRSQTFAQDVIVAQTPPAKATSGQVALLVNRGERGAAYVMPDLIGANGDRAAEILREHGFRVAVVGSTPYPGLAAGIVIRQSPQGGFQVGPGEPIAIEVSR
jgi:eukaryotic-like serine/threonine-protein kinase